MAQNMSFLNIILRLSIMLTLYIVLLLIPAGTIFWLETWICITIASIGFSATIVWFWGNNRSLIQSRSEIRKPPKKWNSIIMPLAILTIFSLFPIAGLDFRFQWSTVPLIIKIGGIIVFSLSFVSYFLVMRENTYLLKVVEVQETHKVISTGPYKVIRHPMYFGVILMVISIRIALGTLLALIPAGIFMHLLIIRIVFEEKTLLSELEGYKEYTQRVQYI